MSHVIIRSIKIDKKNEEITITGADSNSYPRRYTSWKPETINGFYKKCGLDTAKIKILEQYLSGNFQAGVQNKYSRASQLLQDSVSFAPFDWKRNKNHEENIKKNYEVYLKILIVALKTKPPKKEYFISKIDPFSKRLIYAKYRKNSTKLHWTNDRNKATKMLKEQAKAIVSLFQDSITWSISK